MLYVDDLNREIEVDFPPKKIVSLVPSLTELLFDLGLGKQIVGVTKFCCHPKVHCRSKVNVGGTKAVKAHVIDELKPDLIIANKEENDRFNLGKIMDHHPTYVTDIQTIEEALTNVMKIGELTDRKQVAQQLARDIRGGLKSVQRINEGRVAYLIWQEPYMLAASDTYIHELLIHLGFDNAVNDQKRYPILSVDEIRALDPEFIFLSSEPFPFKTVHQEKCQELFPNSKVVLVDGEMFSWYGSRMKLAVDYFMAFSKTLKPNFEN